MRLVLHSQTRSISEGLPSNGQRSSPEARLIPAFAMTISQLLCGELAIAASNMATWSSQDVMLHLTNCAFLGDFGKHGDGHRYQISRWERRTGSTLLQLVFREPRQDLRLLQRLCAELASFSSLGRWCRLTCPSAAKARAVPSPMPFAPKRL